MLNLDTHILVYLVTGELTVAERAAVEDTPWSISAIVLWELSKLVQKGRLDMNLESLEFRQVLANIKIWPLSLEICRLSTNLDFSSDPADELIAATSIVHKLPLLTRDTRILASRQVPFNF